jgi:DNA-directed RNA polymerase subunit RPC12/RpoP
MGTKIDWHHHYGIGQPQRRTSMSDITLPRVEVERALEALLSVKNHGWNEDTHMGRALIATLRDRLAQPEQEPVAYTTGHCEKHKQKGGCQLHNLQCGWPDCDRKPITAPPQPEQEPVNKYCCHSCFNKSGQVFLDRMILCPECGNKRCPKASHHDLPCTTSNEPGQPGSVYTAPQPEQEPVAWLDGPHLVVRLDMRNRLNYQGPWVDLGRAIPDKWTPFLFAAPPQREWQRLTDKEREEATGWSVEHIEAKLKEKNT